ncbi:CHASE3 domain-containing protein [uncultured Fibrella sp.]|uniref:sensor histidine kinase n=1 Tax=uncultured Fibrella sp. TaxID=1284596 RepID=UPI0035CB6DC1
MSFVLAILLISIGFALSAYSYIRSQKDSERIAHTFRVINTLEDVLSLAKDIETGTRGYLITHKTIFLEPCTSAASRVHPELRTLRALLDDNPAQQRSTDTLTRLINAKIAISTRQVRLSRRAPDSIRQAYLLIGKIRMDDIRAHAARMIAVEQDLMQQRRADAHRSFQNTLVLIFALSLLTFAVLLISYNLLDRELRRRAENETQLRQYEHELQGKIQQLEVSNQELERFAFVASHDMQEPLRKIQTFGDLLNQNYPSQVDSNGRLYLNKMLTSADRMSKLIRDLLSFSRLKNEPDAFQRISLGDVLDRVLMDLEVPIKKNSATINVGVMPVLDAVPSQLEQLLCNLISNALKYTKSGVSPIITISAKRVYGAAYPGLHVDQAYYELSITDNGIGFDEKYLDRIFDVFQRLHAKAEYEGTGIGLAICKRVVAYHQGYITARSREGLGTTFIIILPENQVMTSAAVTDTVETRNSKASL